METAPLNNQLAKIGRDLVRWRANLLLTWCIAVVGGLVCLVSLIDLWLRLDRGNRFIAWGILMALVAAGVWLVRRTLRKRYTEEGVAASIEKAFPQLDNRLINHLQFARNSERDPLKMAYVREGGPKLRDLDFEEMRDRDARRRSRITLGVVAAALVLPLLVFGNAWGVALLRTINPFAPIAPVSLTKIVDVQPGKATVVQGGPLELSCTVRGFSGHEVRVDIDPADAEKTTFSLGKITAGGEQVFDYHIKKTTTGLRYRFHAGDAPPSDWFTIDTRPPPAFTGIELTITPPAYTGQPARTLDVKEGALVVPLGSEILVKAASNTPLETVRIDTADAGSIELAATGGATVWTGTTTVTAGSSLRLVGADPHGVALEEEIGFVLNPDRAPAIEIVSPAGRTILPPGERPQIEFRISDDYGLTEVLLEEVPMGESGSEVSGKLRKRWPLKDTADLEEIWRSETSASSGGDLAFRLIARDNLPGEPNESTSSNIIFSTPSPSDLAAQRNELEQKAFAGLEKVVTLQKQNIAQTEVQKKAMAQTEALQWSETVARQTHVRQLTKELLANPLEPLGSLTAAVKKLYVNEMVLAIDSLKAIPAAATDRKLKHADESLLVQNRILRQLTAAQASAAQAKVERRVTGLTSMLTALIKGQTDALGQTRSFVETKAKVSTVLVDAQDELGSDLGAFEKACADEEASVRGNDPAFADTLVTIGNRLVEMKIRADMVIAAERLDDNLPAEAVPLEERALANLKILQELMGDVALEQEEERREAMLEAVAQAKEKIEKIKELHEKMLEAMDAVRGAKDKNDEEFDTMEEAYEELLANTKESLLEVPTDLHIFADLNVANDIVEDVISVFMEIEQAEGSEESSPENVSEMASAKEEGLLEMMEEAQDRLDDMEMWLGETPDSTKIVAEPFDLEELPESGIATGALAAAVEDLIGDLLEEPEDTSEAADDSATNKAMSDLATGNEVMEGDIASFGAKGKSGNETPDHKEQDGRSNVGRQGMSTGETAAGSGTISEGDKNIEERRTEDPTQSGQVDLDGEADTNATGGGKLASGKADDIGMSGGVERMDSNEEGSDEGMAALMAKQADALYAKASLKNVRVDSLKNAAHHIRQSSDAIADGDIRGLKEHRRIAVSELRRAKTQLEAGSSGAMDAEGSAGALDDVVESGPDQAPPQFRDRVAEYYKALNEAL